jgi:hypothetical protein
LTSEKKKDHGKSPPSDAIATASSRFIMVNIWVAAADNEIEAVTRHLDSGVSANVKDPNGYTPIHAAASYGHLDLLRLLISRGGDINIQDNEGDTPLHHAEDVAVAKALIDELHADYSVTNNDGQTPAQYIAAEDEFPELAIYLQSLTHGGNTFIASLPSPGEVEGHQIRYTMQSEPETPIGVNLMGDEDRRRRMEEVLNSENPEEGLRELVQNAVAEGLAKQDEESEKKRRK